MRRINITKNEIRHTVSMQTFTQFVFYLRDNYSFNNVSLLAKKIWDLKVAEPHTQEGYTFSIQSKARVGNQLVL